ncbi:YqgQ family protein [Alteribacter natronophilus]|uniref:YqgQ family protein n=1 Tax=Alteribacter natronophilus TaxID=2583810 RepID=UPI00110E72D3|nr:YqgQ family protein [Alteribacter natronophilus]TMW73796.1 DUF910 family protein [Alteribacter natronophilus]
MNSFYDVQQLLRQFGTVIYTGKRSQDVELMEAEVSELHAMGMIERENFLKARTILLEEKRKARS